MRQTSTAISNCSLRLASCNTSTSFISSVVSVKSDDTRAGRQIWEALNETQNMWELRSLGIGSEWMVGKVGPSNIKSTSVCGWMGTRVGRNS